MTRPLAFIRDSVALQERGVREHVEPTAVAEVQLGGEVLVEVEEERPAAGLWILNPAR